MSPDQQVASQHKQAQRVTDRTWNKAITKAAIVALGFINKEWPSDELSEQAREIHAAITKLRTQ